MASFSTLLWSPCIGYLYTLTLTMDFQTYGSIASYLLMHLFTQ